MTKVFTKERLYAFADAILAIIITILVLELPKPDALTWESIWALKPSFLAFSVSFFSLAVLWTDWHREWHNVNVISDKTVWSMIIVLFFTSFMPYITGLLASDLANSVGQLLYGADLLFVSLFNSLVYRSLAAIEENKDFRTTLIARANLLFINTAIMLVSVILSMTVLSFCSIIGIVIVSILFVLPIFKK